MVERREYIGALVELPYRSLTLNTYMSIIKRLCVAVFAAAATIIPVGAEVQPGTGKLLETLDSNGIYVTYNHESCNTDGMHGSYRWIGMKREMRLCPGETVDALDHAVVRHETIHAIQHCVNMARNTSYNTSVITDYEEFKEFVTANLPLETIEDVMDSYPEDQWATELEAFAGMNAYTSAELERLFIEACVAS